MDAGRKRGHSWPCHARLPCCKYRQQYDVALWHPCSSTVQAAAQANSCVPGCAAAEAANAGLSTSIICSRHSLLSLANTRGVQRTCASQQKQQGRASQSSFSFICWVHSSPSTRFGTPADSQQQHTRVVCNQVRVSLSSAAPQPVLLAPVHHAVKPRGPHAAH
jgi:hypothetical protein